MYKLTRRNVIAFIPTSAVLLCPAVLNAQTVDLDWDDVPTDKPLGEDRLVTLAAGPADIDITDLEPGQVAVLARPTDDAAYSATGMIQYVAVMRRTDAQIAFGASNDPAGAVQDPGYFVVNLLCTHRGKAIGMTGNPDVPFACTDRGGRHSSNYDASGLGVSGASEGERLLVPDYTLSTGATVVLSLA